MFLLEPELSLVHPSCSAQTLLSTELGQENGVQGTAPVARLFPTSFKGGEDSAGGVCVILPQHHLQGPGEARPFQERLHFLFPWETQNQR